MGLSDLNFAKGFSDGMNTGLTLLEHVDRKKQREIVRKREEVQWQDSRDDRRYTLEALRPREERIADLKIRDLRGSIQHRENLRPTQVQSAQLGVQGQRQQLVHNAQMNPVRVQSAKLGVQGQQIGNARGLQQLEYDNRMNPVRLQSAKAGVIGQNISNQRGLQQLEHDNQMNPVRLQSAKLGVQGQKQGQRIQADQHGWAKEDRPLQKKVQRWQFGQMKSQEHRAKGQARRQEQMHNLKLAQQQYVSALKAYEAGDVEQAVSLMMEADDKSGGLYGNFVSGVHGKMATLSREVSTGKRSLNDPEFIAASREFTRPSMRTSGRDADYEFSGIAMGQNGQVAYAMQPKSMDAIVGRMIQLESGGKASAKNPRSSATGAGQFIDSTWLEMIKRHKPELAKKHNDAALLKLRTDQQLSKEMTTRYAEENAKQLAEAGVPVNAANIYLAHHFGIGGKHEAGAVQLLQADPNTPVDQVLPARVMKANPYLKGKTAGELVQGIAQKMSVPATHGMSGDDDDRLVTKEQQDVISEVQTGAVLEQQFMSNTPAPLLQALQQRLAGAGMGGATASKPTKQWDKLDDSTLYNKYTGESKTVGSGGGPGGANLSDQYGAFQSDPMGYISQQVGTRLDHLPPREQMKVTEAIAGSDLSDLSEVDARIKEHELDRDSIELADMLAHGVDQDMQGTDLGRAYQRLASKAQQLGVNESELKAIARNALENAGDESQAVLIEYLGKHLLSVEQHQQERQQYYQNNPDVDRVVNGYELPVMP